MLEQINNFIIEMGTEHLPISTDSVIFPIARLLFLVLSIAAVHNITTKLIAPALRAFIIKASFPLMSYLLKHKFFLNLFRLIPIVLIQYFAGFIGSTTIERLISKLTNIALIGSCAILIFCIINSIYDVLEHKKVTRNAPIKSISQLLKVITVSVTTIMIVSTFIDKSPTYLLSGLGALSAVLLIVFKDPLVNFFAGLQITSQRLVKVGDWVEIDGVVDGTVISINMVNCTIRGWSNQTHTVSLTQLLEGKNWRDMPSIGRHIKRSFYIDVDSVEFLDSDDIERLSEFTLIKKYFKDKFLEQDCWGEEGLKERKDAINCRQLTNVGTFRYYIKHYLIAHPKINEHATILVRQLNPTQQGLPIQIYAFAKPEYSGWVETEELASDIIDWIFAISRRFDITIYQQPSQLGLSKAIMGKHNDSEISLINNYSQNITKSA
jgi:miniconductance mechanosensitive channel